MSSVQQAIGGRGIGLFQAGISEVTVGGFKSIATSKSIDITALTILAGANSSGKSSFLQPLLLLKQTLEEGYDSGPLLLHGPNVKFTSGEQLLSRVSGRPSANDFKVGIRLGPDCSVEVVFRYERSDKETGFQVTHTRYDLFGKSTLLRADMSEDEAQQQWLGLDGVVHGRGHTVVATRQGSFLVLGLKSGDSHTAAPALIPLPEGFIAARMKIAGLIHVSGSRGNRERSYSVATVGPTFAGTFDNYVASVIQRWQFERDKEHLERLNAQVRNMGLARHIQAKRINDAQVEIHVDRLPAAATAATSDFVNIADVGFGVPTVLTVLVALIAAQPEQAVYIEQPELHLHPRAQVKLADVLADAAKRGVRVIAETHSSLLIRGIQTLVAQGELDPKLVKLHWFTRNEEDGATTITSADLDENGAFGDWPMDFDEVELRSEGDYLDAVGLGGRR